MTVGDDHWSLHGSGPDLTGGSAEPVAGDGGLPDGAEDRPGFSGAAGNAC